jgi:hypothetical protein
VALVNVNITAHTRTVAVHVRRGDYKNCAHRAAIGYFGSPAAPAMPMTRMYGLASVAYYTEAWNGILARVALEGTPDMLNNLVVIPDTSGCGVLLAQRLLL